MPLEDRLTSRSAEDYAAFFTPHLRDGMSLLDCGCGDGAISIGLAETFDFERLDALDFEDEFAEAHDYGRTRDMWRLSFLRGDANALPYPDESFDAVFAHSMLETLATPVVALREMRRVLRDGSPIGAASVEYSGVLISGPHEPLLKRFYSLREQQWSLRGFAEPRFGRHLGTLLAEAGFRDVTAAARYISYGDPERVRDFAEARARQCEAGDYAEDVVKLQLGTVDELAEMAEAWRAWGQAPGALFAFPWCMAIGYR